jgi:tripartite motif-containing protein 71
LGSFSYPTGIAVDSSDNVYVGDTFHYKIQKLSTGAWTDITGSGSFSYLTGIAVDSSGNMYVAGISNLTRWDFFTLT